jgi:hypothetical protein
VDLDGAQRLVVEHEAGPLRVTGGFGHGKSVALRARAERLRAERRRPLLLGHGALVALAVEILGRHGHPVRLIPEAAQRRLVEALATEAGIDAGPDEVVATLVGFQASFLGDEELRVHADAAGALDRAEALIALTAAYLRQLAARREVDAGGALVQASLRLRDGDVLAAERSRFDELLVDDLQLASFATNRLLAQLAGPGGALVVAGCPEAAVSQAPLASAAHLDRFARRFGAATVELPTPHRVPAIAPELRLVEDGGVPREVARGLVRRAAPRAAVVVDRAGVEAFVGQEAEIAVVVDATDGRWPAPRPPQQWFDPELFHGPDVPDEDERDRRWRELERRRFLVAASRATRATVVVAGTPVSPFVAELVR